MPNMNLFPLLASHVGRLCHRMRKNCIIFPLILLILYEDFLLNFDARGDDGPR